MGVVRWVELMDEPMELNEKLFMENCGPNQEDRRLFVLRDIVGVVGAR